MLTNKNVVLNSRLYYTWLSFVFKDNVPDSDCSLSLRMWLNTNGKLRSLFHAP